MSGVTFSRYKSIYSLYKEDFRRQKRGLSAIYSPCWEKGKEKLAEPFELYAIAIKKHLELYGENLRRPAVIAESPEASMSLGEGLWYSSHRPYYNIYPGILQALLKVKLDAPCSSLSMLKEQSLCLRLPESHGIKELTHETLGEVKCVLMTFLQSSNSFESRARRLGSEVAEVAEKLLDTKKSHLIISYQLTNGAYLTTCLQGPGDCLTSDAPMGTAFCVADGKFACGDVVDPSLNIDTSDDGPGAPMLMEVARLCLAVSLLSGDDDMIQPDVLVEDRAKLNGASEEKIDALAKKAASRRGGEVGYDVGRLIHEKRDISPHFRNPHLCHFHVGEGRKQVVLKLRKGVIVNRSAAKQVPTGFEEADEAKKRYA